MPPLSDDRILDVGLAALRDAASFATCADPRLEFRSPPVTNARAAVVALGRRAGYRSVNIARALAITPEAVRQLGHRTLDNRVLHATRLRLAIQEAMLKNPKFRPR